MSALHFEWEALQRLRDIEDIVVIGFISPREPMPIGRLFAELDRHMPHYRPFCNLPPIKLGKGES